jgi:hypothetical protein
VALGILLEEHPTQLSFEELVREMTDRPDDFQARDLVETAVCRLVRSGLVHRYGSFVFASHAAVRFNGLDL